MDSAQHRAQQRWFNDPFRALSPRIGAANDLCAVTSRLKTPNPDNYFTIELEPRTYYTSGITYIKADRILIRGNGARVYGQLYIDADDVTVNDLAIDARNRFLYGIMAIGNRISVENCKISGYTTTGLYLTGGSGSMAIGCRITSAYSPESIYSSVTNLDGIIKDCICDNIRWSIGSGVLVDCIGTGIPY